MNFLKKMLCAALITNFIFASESVNSLLDEIEKNEDLSLQTKEESLGISYVITRYQLDMMQARYLRDILKNTLVGYEISRYGVLDPWSANNLPYSSSGIRIFIDNHEITTAKYDNGLFILGNISLSFVDHIEVYYLSPSYKISTEPAYVIIKLYSKNPQRDEGKKISLSYGTYGSYSMNFDMADAKKNYYVHFSKNRVAHDDTELGDTSISRNTFNYHFLWTYQPEQNTKLLFNAIYQHQDPYMGLSMDGKLDDAYEKYKEAHFGIEHKLNDWNLKYTLDYLKDETYFYEQSGLYVQPLETAPYYALIQEVQTKGYDIVNTFKFNSEKNSNKHRFIYGLSYRNKLMNFDELKINQNDIDYNGIKRQDIVTAFVEDNYQMKKNLIITSGIEVSRYFNDVSSDYTLRQYKLGATYLYDKANIYKLSFQHIEYGVPPYLYNTFYGDNELEPQKNDLIIGKYKKILNSENEVEIIGFYGINKNFPMMQEDGTLTSYDKNIYVKMADLKYHRNYNVLNDLIVDYIYLKLDNVNLERSHKFIILNTHRYKKYDFFENIVYKNNKYTVRGNTDIKAGIDVSVGVKYNYNKDLSIFVKGENLFNNEYENSFYTVENFDPTQLEQTNVQLIDRKVTAGLEYWF